MLHQLHQPVFPKTLKFVKYPGLKMENKNTVFFNVFFHDSKHITRPEKRNTKLLIIYGLSVYGYVFQKSLKIHVKPPDFFKKNKETAPLFTIQSIHQTPSRLLELPTIWRDSMDPILVSCPSYVPGGNPPPTPKNPTFFIRLE